MFVVKTEAEFAAAHFLTHYHGKCERLHGHNYRVVVYLRGETLDSGGMLADFLRVKSALRKILGDLDHTNLNDNSVFKGDPSAERIAEYIFNRMKTELPAYDVNAAMSAVDVYETPLNMGRYEE